MRNDFQIRILQVCLVVRDVEKAVRHFEDLIGVGPFSVYTVDSKEMPGVTYRGLPGDYCVKVAMTKVGGGVIELIENQRGKNIYTEFLEKHGEGIHHIAVQVDDCAAALAQLKAAGVRTVDDSPRPGARGSKVAFVHPSATGGVLLELVEKAT